MEQVSRFSYLGCEVTFLDNKDLTNKLNKFRYICGTIQKCLKNRTRKDTRLKFYKTMAVPVVLYGSETWVLSKREQTRLQAAEMKFLRAVKGCTLEDRNRNEDIRNELGIFSLDEKRKTYKRNWCNHLERMENERLPRVAREYEPGGQRSVGRPRRRWFPEQAVLPNP